MSADSTVRARQSSYTRPRPTTYPDQLELDEHEKESCVDLWGYYPLGLRALNWEQNGYDTLIRFHGTANESSIRRAASHGCVRMLNADVIELFGLVDTGTVIVSGGG